MGYHLGSFLKNQASRLNFSAEELAKKINKTESTVYVDFRKKDLNTKVFIQYCEALEINPTIAFKQFFPIQEEDNIDLTTDPIFNKKLEEFQKELNKLNQWLSDREELVKLYKKENSRLQEELENCLSKLKGNSGQMVG